MLREAEVYAAQHVVVCPRCKTEGMFPAQANELLLQGCGACGGVWMDEPSSRRLVAEPSEEAVRLANLAAHNAKRPVSVEATLSCPVCTEPMKHHDFPNAGLRLDVCAAEGTCRAGSATRSGCQDPQENRRTRAMLRCARQRH